MVTPCQAREFDMVPYPLDTGVVVIHHMLCFRQRPWTNIVSYSYVLFQTKAATAGAIAFGIAVQPALAGNVDNGEQVFNANCAACHAGGQNVIMPEKTLEKEALEQYLAGGRNEKSVITQVTNGKNAMPAFGGRLDDEAIADVAAYVIATSEAGWD